jgi:hypothetical protein
MVTATHKKTSNEFLTRQLECFPEQGKEKQYGEKLLPGVVYGENKTDTMCC